MFRNYIKTAFRNLKHNKAFTAINTSGLVVGLAVFMLIMLWVKNEMSYNNFHKDKQRIAAVMVNRINSNDVATFPACPSKLAPAMKNDMPAVEYTARCSWGDVKLFSYNAKDFSEAGLYVDPSFLSIFSFPLVKGDINTVLKQPNSLVITETIAKKYFGHEDPIGKVIMVEKSLPYTVQGVVKDVPLNSTIHFDFLMPFNDYMQTVMHLEENWANNNIRTYVKLAAGTDMAALNASAKNFMQHYTDEQKNTTMFFWGMNDWYLRKDFKNGVYGGGGRIAYVNMFTLIAIFILLLACINFMNLSTARATQRAREVGVRKVIGANRMSLILQFIGESLLLSFIAGLIALVFIKLVLPSFNTLLGKQIEIDFFNSTEILAYLGIIILTGILAGSYPSFVLSAFRPVKVLKSNAATPYASTGWVRKGLVVIQFSVSIMLIIGTIVVYKQLNLIRNKNLGYNKENLIWFPNSIPADKNEAAIAGFKKLPGVVDVARATTSFTSPNNRGEGVLWPNKQPGEDVFFTFITGDENIIQTMGIEMKEGRAFSKEYGTDTAAFIINEEAAKRMGLKHPVGQPIETYGGKGTIIGVAKDFHTASLHDPMAPVIIDCHSDWTWLYYVRIDGKNTAQTIAGIEKIYKQLAPGYSLDYTFQDKQYETTYRSEQQIQTLVNWFAFFAILISCLGLFGLTLFTVERKTKEIGIRKVLGASITSIIALITKQFIVLIAIAIIIGVFPAWYFMNDWLQQYAYRVSIRPDVFIMAGGIALLIAFVTIAALALKAANANPSKSLRTE